MEVRRQVFPRSFPLPPVLRLFPFPRRERGSAAIASALPARQAPYFLILGRARRPSSFRGMHFRQIRRGDDGAFLVCALIPAVRYPTPNAPPPVWKISPRLLPGSTRGVNRVCPLRPRRSASRSCAAVVGFLLRSLNQPHLAPVYLLAFSLRVDDCDS